MPGPNSPLQIHANGLDSISMRVAQILTPALLALATAACAHQQANYYALDSTAHQPVPVVRPYAPASYAQPQYAQAAQRQPATATSGRGLFSSPQIAEQSYAQANPSQPAYQAQTTQPQFPPGGRGLFNTFAENQTIPTYPQPAYAQRAYAPQPTARPSYARNGAQPSYAQTQERRYLAYSARAPYQPPSYGSAATYAAVAQSNPFQQARWY